MGSLEAEILKTLNKVCGRCVPWIRSLPPVQSNHGPPSPSDCSSGALMLMLGRCRCKSSSNRCRTSPQRRRRHCTNDCAFSPALPPSQRPRSAQEQGLGFSRCELAASLSCWACVQKRVRGVPAEPKDVRRAVHHGATRRAVGVRCPSPSLSRCFCRPSSSSRDARASSGVFGVFCPSHHRRCHR